jgi:hypothetical protein
MLTFESGMIAPLHMLGLPDGLSAYVHVCLPPLCSLACQSTSLLGMHVPPPPFACPAEFEFALRSMFSSTPASGRRAADGSGAGAASDAEDAAGRVIKVIADKRALQVGVCA